MIDPDQIPTRTHREAGDHDARQLARPRCARDGAVGRLQLRLVVRRARGVLVVVDDVAARGEVVVVAVQRRRVLVPHEGGRVRIDDVGRGRGLRGRAGRELEVCVYIQVECV